MGAAGVERVPKRLTLSCAPPPVSGALAAGGDFSRAGGRAGASPGGFGERLLDDLSCFQELFGHLHMARACVCVCV